MENIKSEKSQNEEQLHPSISIKGLYKAYGSHQVLKGLDLDVYPGEVFGFIGKNGVGKSTTIDCMIGVKKFEKGTILLDDIDIKKEPLLAKSVFGYVASEPVCYETMTGLEYLDFIASIFQISEGEFKKNYEYLASRLDLKESELNQLVSSYSHGMKQKLCLIASLIHNPDIWVLDEPTVGLDIMAVEELKKMMKEYAAHGKTVFITSHNIELVSKLCDRVAIVNNGVIYQLLDFKRNPNKALQLPRIFLEVYGEEK